jgi:hypothetical protein
MWSWSNPNFFRSSLSGADTPVCELSFLRHDFPIIASITWTRTIFVGVAAGNTVA